MLKSAAILLSRQNLRPSLSHEWVIQLKRAIEFVKTKKLVLLSSVGSPNWEIITASALLEKIPLRILIPSANSSDFASHKSEISEEFQLTKFRFEFDIIYADTSKQCRPESYLIDRDKVILEQADVLIPVSIRPNGNMSSLLSQLNNSEKEIVTGFEAEYTKRTDKLGYRIREETLCDVIKNLDDSYLIHWTRTFNSAWPDENKLEFYEMVMNSVSYGRTAFDSLRNILSGESIIASYKNMPSKIKTVSLSGLAPAEVVGLMRWRARYSQMSFEPFGIGIEKQYGLTMGIRAVQYINPLLDKRIVTDDRWLFQSTGKKTDWTCEKEFRYRGNLDFSKVPREQLIIFCHFRDQARQLSKRFGIEAVWFCD